MIIITLLIVVDSIFAIFLSFGNFMYIITYSYVSQIDLYDSKGLRLVLGLGPVN